MEGVSDTRSERLLAAIALFAAAGLMALGGIIKRAIGADLDAALATGDLDAYFTSVAANDVWLTVNLTAWILGAFLFGVAAAALAYLSHGRRLWAQIGLACYWTGVPLAIGSFVAWLALTTQIGPGASADVLETAELIGWWVSRADWIATVLLVGLGPLLLSFAGRGDWAPTWLVWLGAVAAIAGSVTILSLFTGGLTTYGQAIIPVGLVWTISAGVVLSSSRDQ